MAYIEPVQPKGKQYINRWDSYSPRLDRDVLLYNDLLYDFWALIETDPSVETFCERPLKIKQLVDGNIIESTFDMWVRYKDGNEIFFGIKYSKAKASNKLENSSSRKLEAQRLWCEKQGYNYLVRTDQHIRENKIFLANMKALIPYLKQHLVQVETDKYLILKRLSSCPCTIGVLLKNTGLPLTRLYETLASLYIHGVIQCNFGNLALGLTTEVWIDG